MSVDMNYRQNQLLQGAKGGIGIKKHSQQRDYSLRVKSINETDKLNNSVHEFSIHRKNISQGNELNLQDINAHSKSLMKNLNLEDINFNDKKKEILDKKRYDQMNKNYN